MADLDADVDLLPSVRQLISSVSASIQGSESLAAAEDMMVHLEGTDENFHRYELVKYIKGRIDEVLGPLIEEEIERRNLDMPNRATEEAAVGAVTEKVINDPACAEMMHMLKISTRSAVERLIQAYDDDQRQRTTSRGPLSHSYSYPQRTTHSLNHSSGDDESSLDSSFNQSSFMFMNQEEFTSITESLDTSQPIQRRRDALHTLLQVPPSDILACENWGRLKAGLVAALADSDEKLSESSLRFHARMFSSSSHNVMREMYTNLVDHLSNEFVVMGSKGGMPLHHGIDATHHATQKLLKKFRLMNEFQLEVPKYWIRFPDKFIQDLTESTLNLLVQKPHPQAECLTPMCFMALLDPKALWFKKWMNAHYSRTVIISHLEATNTLLADSVAQCLDFVDSRSAWLDSMDDLSDRFNMSRLDTSHRTKYTQKELQFLVFIKALSILSRLLVYCRGRQLFPISVRGKEVSVTDLVRSLLPLVIKKSFQVNMPTDTGAPSPAMLVTEMLKIISMDRAACVECLCKDDVVDDIIKPVRDWLNKDKPSTDLTMLCVAEILSAIASWEKGTRLLLYGENGNSFQHNPSAAVHIITEFCKRALDQPIATEFLTQPSRPVTGVFLYVCRQLYSNSEGLLVLHPYGLHHSVANVWREASREVELGATPIMEDSEVTAENMAARDAFMWEQNLLDNLLNFAGTAKGMLLLQQTGVINECVAYMYGRYTKKLQVSKMEKFGYGAMVTQVSATAPGMVALQSSGFIKTLVTEMWSVLECGKDDQPVLRPGPYPTQPIDRASHKYFLNMVNLLSAFPAVYEVLVDQPLQSKDFYSFREMPETIPDVIDRLIIVDSEAKRHSLFNLEESHVFGLRLLSVLVSCLDTLLLLETQYRIWDRLLQDQNDNRMDSGDVMIDMLAVERNHILVRSFVIGGPTERILPPRMLTDDPEEPFPWPLVTAFPVPKEYIPSVSRPSTVKQDNDLMRTLFNVAPSLEWLNDCKEAFCSLLSDRHDALNTASMAELLEHIVTIQSELPEFQVIPTKPWVIKDSALKSHRLSGLQELGTMMAVRYGQQLKLVMSAGEATEDLTLLLKRARYFLHAQQRNLESELRGLDNDYVGHDWFVCTIFLLFGGNKDRAWNTIHKFSSLLVSPYLWMPRLHASTHLPVELAMSGIRPVFSTTCYLIELILQTELPQVYSAFRLSGYTASQICQQWLSQCFWNFLNWPDICLYVCLCVLMGCDYQVYLCVAILRYMQPKILLHTQQQKLQVFLKENGLDGFHVGDHLDYMKDLERKFRGTVLQDMQSLSKA
ncbi:protein broad-minded-like [Diadema antillarum]|uniref:protein broad-minded-like n=1 Tax=Diadema antillarum TaxID=105358 RepID=UPI003A8A636A